MKVLRLTNSQATLLRQLVERPELLDCSADCGPGGCNKKHLIFEDGSWDVTDEELKDLDALMKMLQ